MLNVRARSRVRLLAVSLPVVAFGACNCDNDLHSFPGTIQGLVCNAADGQAFVNGALTVQDADGNDVDVTADDHGAFTAQKVASGNATITIHDAGGDRTATVFVEPGKTARFADSTCHPPPPPEGGAVDGCVCNDAAGAWVVGANVYVVTDAGSVFSTGTDPNGCFDLPDVTPGAQTLKVQKGAFYKEYPVTVVAGQTVDIPAPADCAPPPPPPGSGTVQGRVCASDGQTWLAGATVTVTNPDGSIASQATTDGDGRYTLTGVPAGQQNVDIVKGSFSTTVPVTVTADQTTTIPDDQCAITNPAVKIAVVTGQYDNVQQVLTDLGVDGTNVTTYDGASFPTHWNTDLLDDYATLSQYDIVFLNCGLDDNPIVLFPDQTAIANLRQFVQNGGSVYASDWAYSVVETAWPNEIDYHGNDSTFDALTSGGPKVGNAVDGLNGTITDTNLAAGMGSSSIALDYKLYEWVVMDSVAPDVTVYIRGDAPLEDGTTLSNVPHTVGFNSGAGRVLYTSFHQEPGVNQQQERVLQLLMFEL